MKIPVMLQPFTQQQFRGIQQGSKQGQTSFADVLSAEMAGSRRVITAEQIEAELDGTPTWEFLRPSLGNDTYGQTQLRNTKTAASLSVGTVLEKIRNAARRYGVDEDLVREVVRAESNFNPNATSRAGAKGLMQLMDSTARAMHVRNAYDPDENLAGGTRYLKQLLDRFDGNVGVALAAYNAGPTRISRLGIANDQQLKEKYHLLPAETQRYVQKILSRLQG